MVEEDRTWAGLWGDGEDQLNTPALYTVWYYSRVPSPSTLHGCKWVEAWEGGYGSQEGGCTFLYPGQNGQNGNYHTQDERGAYVHFVERAAGELDKQEVQHVKMML